MNFSICDDSSHDSKKVTQKLGKTNYILRVIGHMSHVTCHQSLTPTATDPKTANTPNMESRLVYQEAKIIKI